MFSKPALGKLMRCVRIPASLVVMLAMLGAILSCEQQSPDPAAQQTELDSQAVSGAETEPVARVRFSGLEQVEALVPFGMLRLHPVKTPADPWLRLRHARSTEGVDFEIRWQLDQPLESETMALRGGPGWFNVGAPGQPQIEASASQRGAHYRFQAPAESTPVLALSWLDFGQAQAGQLEATRGRRSINGQFTGRGGETLFVVVRFSRAFRTASRNADGSLGLAFDERPESLEIALSLSTVDINGARANLESAGVPDFAGVQRGAREVWNTRLERLGLSGGEALRRRAHLALYRLIAAYGDMADSDGRYRAANDAIRRVVPGRSYLGNLSPEQNFRTVIPMLSLIEPDIMADLFETVMTHQRVSGDLPQRTVWGRARPSTALDPFAAVMAALASRSLPRIDAAQALPSLLKASLPGSPDLPWSEYERLGYFSFDALPTGSVSRSLQAASVHHATAALAARLGERDLAQAFAVRVLFYRQLFDPQERLFRGRDNARDWRTPFRPLIDGRYAGPGSQDYDDGDPWTALWSVAQFDVEGLLSLLGGRQELTSRLDAYFELSHDGELPGQEWLRIYQDAAPSHWHVPWLYPLSNEPQRGQHVSSLLFATAPASEMTPQRAAWELFTLLGFYPVNPSSGQYVLGVPQVASARLGVGDEQLFIEAAEAGSRLRPGLARLASGAAFDGSRLPGYSISHQRLAGGGTLEFLMPGSDAVETK